MNEHLREALEMDDGPDMTIDSTGEVKDKYRGTTIGSGNFPSVSIRDYQKAKLSAAAISELASLALGGKSTTKKVSSRTKAKAKNKKKIARASRKKNR